MKEGSLPKEMDVKQSKGIHLSMLVLNMYSCLCRDGARADLNPLAEIINQQQQSDTSVSNKITCYFIIVVVSKVSEITKTV